MSQNYNSAPNRRHATRRQSGSALVVGLIFLIVLTLLGLTAAQTGIQEERMAGNTRDRNIAFQAAEAALRDAEADTRCLTPSGSKETSPRPFGCILGKRGASSACSYGLCCNQSGFSCVEPATPVYTKFTSTSSPGVSYGTYTSAPKWPTMGKQPQYLIEPFSWQNHNYYRISAQGYGANASTVVTLQEIYKE